MRFPFFRNRDSVKNGILISIRRTGDGFHPGLFIFNIHDFYYTGSSLNIRFVTVYQEWKRQSLRHVLRHLQNFCHGQICCPKTLESRKKPVENKQTAKAVCYLSRYSYSTVYFIPKLFR